MRGESAAHAIMTTDTVAKTAVISRDGWTIGGMAKGAGMLAPGLATMLVVLTTDAVLEPLQADEALRRATGRTFDRLDSDRLHVDERSGTLLANGASDVVPDLDDFAAALTELCQELAVKLQAMPRARASDITIEVQHRGVGAGRRRGRPVRRAQQPLQGRDLRQRPQTGDACSRDRHHGARSSTPTSWTSG